MCSTCHRLETRRLEPSDITSNKKRLPGTKRCKHCLRGIGYPSPRLADIPEQLRGLSWEVIMALRPLEIDCGHPPSGEVRASDGYRIHVDVIRFRWEVEAVSTKIDMLPTDAKSSAKNAFKYLQEQEHHNAYRKFQSLHDEFLEEHGEHADAAVRRLPVNFMEHVGLENAVWPH
eukprot:3805713-Amphidinium_carterae.1